MRGPHNIWRLVRTGATLERTGAMAVVLEAFRAPPSIRIAARLLGWPFKWLGLKGDPALPSATRALTALGPAYIKFGQILSTRPDVVGDALAVQLRVLQDRLPPFPLNEAKTEIERDLGLSVDQLFSFVSEPVAAASIAQVHRARLADTGEEVASTWASPQPLSFELTEGGSLPGLIEGLEGMKVGGRRQLHVPFAEAWGPEGQPDIGLPAETDVIIVVDLLATF